ncbi:hypothetical protein ACFVW2_27990 [Streptomyces sp. NPDC058171]
MTDDLGLGTGALTPGHPYSTAPHGSSVRVPFPRAPRPAPVHHDVRQLSGPRPGPRRSEATG